MLHQAIELLEQSIDSLHTSLASQQAALDALYELLPVDAVLSDWSLQSFTDWSVCSLDGMQSRTETWGRIILVPAKNGGWEPTSADLVDVRTATQACTYEPPPPPPSIPADRHAYFEYLASRPDVHLSLKQPVALALRTQEQIDAVPTGSDAPTKWPVIYDPVHDAMLQRTLGGKGVNAIQKQPRIAMGSSSLLATWDFKIGAGATYQGDGSLKQYKAYRFDHGTNTALWLSIKLKFPLGANPPGIAELLVTGIPQFMAPGTTNTNSEILEPRLARFYPQAETWTRVWVFADGPVGNAPTTKTPVFLSVWAADETRDAVQLYDRLALYAATDDIRQLRFEYNTSESGPFSNPLIEMWNRNFVVLKGVTPDTLPPFVKPVA